MRTCACLLLLALAAGGGWAECPHEASDLLAWDDPAAWDSGAVPVAGDDVTISQPVLLSSATPALGSVTIPAGGRLVFAPVTSQVVQLSANMVELTGGQLWIGSEDCPYETRADLVLTGLRDVSEDAASVQKAVHVRSGVLEVHGKSKRTWTKLAATVPKTVREDAIGNPIYDASQSNVLNARGVAMVELAPDGTLVKNWWRVNVAKINRVASHTGNILMLAVVGSVKFGSRESPAEIASALEAVCYDNSQESGLRNLEVDQRTAWVAICAIGSPSDSAEEVGVTRNGRSATQRLVKTIGNVDFAVLSIVSLKRQAIVMTEALSYTTGTVPSLEVLVSMNDDVSSWEAGDWIVLASTDFDHRQSEEFQLLDCPECDANTVKISGPVFYTHWGEVTDGIDMRGEVGVMTRNVRIFGEMEDACYGDNLCNKFDYDTFGGQIKFLSEFETARIENAEIFNMGQQSVLGSYPIHFHMCLDTSEKDVYLRGNSIHDTFSRCITIHGTHNVTVLNNFAYKHLGHCYFLEDGGEQDNIFEGNLGFGTYAGTLIPTDRMGRVSTFWITNPDNEIINNVAAGSQGMGFWILMPDLPIGASALVNMGLEDGQAKRTLVKKFSGNVAHGNPTFGFRLDNELLPNGDTDTLSYRPLVDPTNPDSEMALLQLDDFTGYKNGESVWIKSLYTTLTNYRIAESPIGIIFASSGPGFRNQHREMLANSRIVGETANKGEPATVRLLNGTKVQLDRSVEVFGSPLSARIGIAFYRGPVHVWDTTFAGFEHNEVRQAGAIGKKPSNPYLSSPIAGVRNVTFEFSDPSGGSRYYDGDGTSFGYEERDGNRHNVILDVDGSLTTYPGASVVRPIPMLMNARCVLLPNWGPGTGLCPDRFTRVALFRTDKIPTFVTRNDLQANAVEAALAERQISYSLNSAESYILHFNTTVPQQFILQPFGLQLGLAQLFGVCVGAHQQFRVRPMRYSEADSLSEVLEDDANEKYFYDSAVGVVMFRFTNQYPRSADTTSHCPGDLDDAGNGECDVGPRILLTASNDDGDCRARAYPAYATEPVSSEGALTVPTFE